MRSRTRAVIGLASTAFSISLFAGCDNSANDGGVNATRSISDPGGPKSQEEYARKQLADREAAKKASRPGK